jgi:hypothetical protein
MRFTASRVVATAALLLSGALVAGCGDDAGNADTPAQTRTAVTVIREVPADTPADTATRDEQSRDVAESPSTNSPGSASNDDSAQSASGRIRVPSVVGKDHQLAQDTMQAAGLYNLSEEDATGQGRMLLFDRNWTVVSQSPKAGSRVSEDATITLRSKKDGE